MQPEFGNAAVYGVAARGWIVGHFVKTQPSLRATDELEIKWGEHDAGKFTEWKSQPGKKTITLLVSGKMLVQFRSGKKNDNFTLSTPGDFVIWDDNRKHRWKAITKTIVISIRWPSLTRVETLKRKSPR
jgi:quercetin dioxygenase-like cupin family protein